MASSLPRGRKPRKVAGHARATNKPASAPHPAAFPLRAFALGTRSPATVRGPGAWEFSVYLSGEGDR